MPLGRVRDPAAGPVPAEADESAPRTRAPMPATATPATASPAAPTPATVAPATDPVPMTPERWRVITRVVQDALERPPAERPALLDAACAGDPALRGEVESLLAAAGDATDGASGFLDDAVAALGEAALADQAAREAALAARLSEALAGRFALEGELGRGGMGVVYRARDLRHPRLVALKVLRPEFAASLGAARFRREVAYSAALQHPHIVPVFESGEVDGAPWFAMPYVAGESLRHRIAREGRLRPADAVRIVRQVALALDHAHRRGVVHRDVKPENVLLSDDHALVADFGVAKALDAARDVAGADGVGALTLPGSSVVVGTPAYMAPEQAVGEPVDARADLYAWGVLAYELLAGRHPFAGVATAQQLLAAQLHVTPAPLREVAPSLPAPLAALVTRCLAKRPEDRPPSAAALLAELDAAMTPGADDVPGPRGEPADTAPSAPRPSRRMRRRAGLAAAACGVALLAFAGARVRRAISAADPRLRPAPAAGAPARAPAPGPPGRGGSADRGTRDPAAYDLYLRARYEVNQGRYASGIALFERAVARDPSFAAGWSGMAAAWAMRPINEGSVSSVEALPLVQRAAARALALDSLSGEAHIALGYATASVGEVARGEALLRRGAALEPRSASARSWLAEVQYKAGRFDDAERSLREVLAREPLDGAYMTNLANQVARDPARWEEARALAHRAAAVDPGSGGALVNAARVLAATRDHEASLAMLRRLGPQGARRGDAPLTLAVNMLALGHPDSAARVLAALEREEPTPAVQESVADLSAGLGRWDRAFAEAAALARARRNVSFLGYGAAPSLWRPAADDPRLRPRLRALCLATWAGCDSVLALVARTPPLRRLPPRGAPSR